MEVYYSAEDYAFLYLNFKLKLKSINKLSYEITDENDFYKYE